MEIFKMTIREYIDTMKVSGVISTSKLSFLVELFNSTCTNENVTEDAAKKWLYPDKGRKSVTNYNSYFNEDEVNESGFYDYLKRRIHSRWGILQNSFKTTTIENIVDCETEDEVIFYRSLLAQFLRILNRPVPKDMYVEKLNANENTNVSQSNSITKQITEIFSSLLYEHGIVEVLSADYLECSLEIYKFVKVVKSKILFRFLEAQDEPVYSKIIQFIKNLENYNSFCLFTPDSCNNVLDIIHDVGDDPHQFGKSALFFRKELDKIYGEIFPEHTLFVLAKNKIDSFP